MPTFTPPVAFDNPPYLPTTKGVQKALFKYYGPYPVGVSVVFVSGHWVTKKTPDNNTEAQGTDGINFFLGGHIYTITSTQAASLTADGFGAYIA